MAVKAALLIENLASPLRTALERIGHSGLNAEAINRLSQSHASGIYQLLQQRVYPYRTRRIPADQFTEREVAGRDPEDPFPVIAQDELTFLGKNAGGNADAILQQMIDVLGLEGRLDASEILYDILQVEAQLLRDVGALIGKDVTVRDVERMHGGSGDSSGAIEDENTATDAVTAAQAQLFERVAPLKQILCFDMDGVLATLKPQNPDAKGPLQFRDTRLGHRVHENVCAFLSDIAGKSPQDIDDLDTEMGLLPYVAGNLATFMQQKYGDRHREETAALVGKVFDRIRQIYRDSYPSTMEDRALHDAQAHIESMPFAYHAFRHHAWDHALRDIYDGGNVGPQMLRVKERGGHVVFITAAPRIHAIKMLKEYGIMDALGPDNIELYTVEDIYREGTIADGTYKEGDKGMILERIHREHGIPKELIAMGGDQVASDIFPALAVGIQARIVLGPQEVEQYLASVRLPLDPAA